ncbi:MAG: hypothetical protein OXO50_18370, partial [Caldilineaceae bacterium]|nr:hypothetical protein [Caldilineaceae bacterium]
MKRFMISALLVLLLAACGVGSDGPALSVASLDEPSRPLGATWTESRSPWFQIDNNTHVGSGVIEGLLDNLTGSPAGHHGETAIWYGQAENGIERS